MLIKKYIRTNEGFILFPEECQHGTMALAFLPRAEIISAGFIVTHDGQLCCVGESSSLDIGSRLEDTELLNEWLES